MFITVMRIKFGGSILEFLAHFAICFSVMLILAAFPAAAQFQPVSVTMTDEGAGATLDPSYLGLSYEMSMLLPHSGRYYFSANDQALVNTFKTLGIKSLRVGANAVDDPHVPIPDEKDIDALFNFARASGVKVIYSFRLKNADSASSVRLASYIALHDDDALDCFAIGNEPNFYLPSFNAFLARWKSQYDAILKAVPGAMFIGPSVANKPPATQNSYPVELADAVFTGGHLAMASDHYYFLGRRNEGESDPPASRAKLLSNDVDAIYAAAYANVGSKLAACGVPYRIDELNSYARGGAKDSSDTYASTLWALDCTHWWATHHILGVNYHTGEFVLHDGGFDGASYSAFVHRSSGVGFVFRPQAYAYLAFTQGARGRPIDAKVQMAPTFNFNAYAYRDHDGSVYLTLINKSYGDTARIASVSVQLPIGTSAWAWQRIDLQQRNQDVAAKAGVTLGGGGISPQGIWSGQWSVFRDCESNNLTIQVPPASATLLRFSCKVKSVATLGLIFHEEP